MVSASDRERERETMQSGRRGWVGGVQGDLKNMFTSGGSAVAEKASLLERFLKWTYAEGGEKKRSRQEK